MEELVKALDAELEYVGHESTNGMVKTQIMSQKRGRRNVPKTPLSEGCP
jgi:hypothetical protein